MVTEAKLPTALELAARLGQSILSTPDFSVVVQKQWFQAHCSGEDNLLYLDGFTQLLTSLGEDRSDCERYFDSFCLLQQQQRQALTLDEFIIGTLAMSWQTPHVDDWGLLRLQYIFRFFDADHDSMLSFDEFKALVHRILCQTGASGHGVYQDDVDKCAAVQATHFQTTSDKLSLPSFVTAVTTGKFRNTSKLFRFVSKEQGSLTLSSSSPQILKTPNATTTTTTTTTTMKQTDLVRVAHRWDDATTSVLRISVRVTKPYWVVWHVWGASTFLDL